METGSEITCLKLKWQGRDLEASVPSSETIAGLKRVLEQETHVLAKKQKLLGLKTQAGKPATDETAISDLALKPNQRIMLLGTAEEALHAMAAQEVQPHVQSHDDLDDDLEDAAPLDLVDRPEIQEKLRRRVQQAIVKEITPPRPGKKCAVLDIDYTFFDLSSVAENPADLARPFIHDFLAAIHPYFDIIIWSATSMKWIDVKLRELGVAAHPEYKITATMDYTAMVTVDNTGHRKPVFDCKPLQVLWQRFPEHYSPRNTIMLDDLRRNYVLNVQNGLVIRPFRKALTSGRHDREMLRLKAYFLKIAQLESLEDLDHSRWEKYAKREIRELEEQHDAGGGGAAGGGTAAEQQQQP